MAQHMNQGKMYMSEGPEREIISSCELESRGILGRRHTQASLQPNALAVTQCDERLGVLDDVFRNLPVEFAGVDADVKL